MLLLYPVICGYNEPLLDYSETYLSGPSQKRTTSVKQTTIKAPIEFTTKLASVF